MSYTRQSYISSEDFNEQHAARHLNDIEWNSYIGKEISKELHKRLLPYNSEYILPYKDILPLLEAGYLGTVIEILEQTEAPLDKLEELKQWLIQSCKEATVL